MTCFVFLHFWYQQCYIYLLLSKTFITDTQTACVETRRSIRCFGQGCANNIHYCTCSTDKAFPVVNLHFEDSLKLTVHPQDYLFSLRVSQFLLWCVCIRPNIQRVPCSCFKHFCLSRPQIELFHFLQEDMYCFGWQSGGMTTQDGSDVILLGGKFQILLSDISHL